MKKLAVLIILALGFQFAMAQEEMEPQKWENTTWQIIEVIKFKSGHMDEAKEVIEKYKAAGEPGQMPEMYWFVFGEWDLMLMWEVPDGPSYLEWKRSPRGIKWYKKFLEQQGSKEEAEKVMEAYSETVQDSKSFLTRQTED